MTADTYPVMKRIMTIYHRNNDDSGGENIQQIVDEVGMDVKIVIRCIALGILNERRADFYLQIR